MQQPHATSLHCINDTALICLTESFDKEAVEEEKGAATQGLDQSQHGLQLDYQSSSMSLRLI